MQLFAQDIVFKEISINFADRMRDEQSITLTYRRASINPNSSSKTTPLTSPLPDILQ